MKTLRFANGATLELVGDDTEKLRGVEMKTLIKLRKNEAAIVFSPQGARLIQPEGEEPGDHVALAGALVYAMQYTAFKQMTLDFLRQVAAIEGGDRSTH